MGLIESCWGGTLCEAWTSRQGLAKHPDFQDIDAIQARAWERYAQALKKYEEAREEQEEMLEGARLLRPLLTCGKEKTFVRWPPGCKVAAAASQSGP